MHKKLAKSGNSYALVFDKALMEAAQITPETPLEISTNGDVIMIQPVRAKSRQAKLKALSEKMHAEYAGAFRRLAK